MFGIELPDDCLLRKWWNQLIGVLTDQDLTKPGEIVESTLYWPACDLQLSITELRYINFKFDVVGSEHSFVNDFVIDDFSLKYMTWVLTEVARDGVRLSLSIRCCLYFLAFHHLSIKLVLHVPRQSEIGCFSNGALHHPDLASRCLITNLQLSLVGFDGSCQFDIVPRIQLVVLVSFDLA
jgi:hypothetical protein